MRRFWLISLIALVFLFPALSRAQQTGGASGALTAQGSGCVSTNCVQLNIAQGVGGATITLSNTFSGTVQFEALGDSTSQALWVALSVTPSNSTTTVTSATGTGTWQVNVAGYIAIRVRCSTFSSGTINVTIHTSTTSARGGSGAGGSGSGVVSGQANDVIPLGTTSNSITQQSHLDDGATTPGTITSSEPVAVTGSVSATGGVTAPGFTSNGSNNGFVNLTYVASAPTAPGTNTVQLATNTAVPTPYTFDWGAPVMPLSQTFSSAGAASKPGLVITGAPYKGGSATTNFPQIYYNCTGASAPTSFSTGGTLLGFNACTSSCSNMLDLHVNGGNSLMNLDCSGDGVFQNVTIQNGLSVTLGNIQSPQEVNYGNSFTVGVTGAGCGSTVSSITGGPTAGSWVSAGGTSCVFTVTMGSAIGGGNQTAPHRYFCKAYDVTTTADLLTATGGGTATCIFTGTTVASDVIIFASTPF